MPNQPNDAVEKLRLGAWLPFAGDVREAQDGVSWPREAKDLRDALVAFGEEAAAAAVRLVEKCAARVGWAAPATGCRATLTINGYGFAGAARQPPPSHSNSRRPHAPASNVTSVSTPTSVCAATSVPLFGVLAKP